jgi:hypothetical protein
LKNSGTARLFPCRDAGGIDAVRTDGGCKARRPRLTRGQKICHERHASGQNDRQFVLKIYKLRKNSTILFALTSGPASFLYIVKDRYRLFLCA